MAKVLIVSPVAMLTWVSRVGALGKELELLVIWRGSPGWFFKGAQGGSSTSGNSASFQTSIRYGPGSC
jgi:hypothetical protein